MAFSLYSIACTAMIFEMVESMDRCREPITNAKAATLI
jgi:hypothetical protein